MTSVDLAQAAQLAAWREAQALDLPFIFNSWLNSYRSAPAVEGVPKRDYFAGQHEVIRRLLERCSVLIACDGGTPEDIWGYVVFEVTTVHFTYVKTAFRRFGIASELLRRARLEECPHSHSTHLGRPLALKFRSTFNPYLAR